MKIIRNLAGGFAGAVALNMIHETVKRLDHDAPQINLVAEEAIGKTADEYGIAAPKGTSLFAAALTGDLVSNTVYYSLIGAGGEKYLFWRGAGYGIAAGIGALKLTKSMGLDDVPVNKTDKTKALTVSYYLLGGLVAAWAIKIFSK